MNEDPTKKFSDFEARVLSELSAILAGQVETRREIAALGLRVNSIEERLTSVEGRLTSLEDKVDARLRETRPIWEAVLEDIKRLDMKFDEVIRDIFDVRTGLRSHEKRLYQLENLR
jgi:chromosome segregation ATPase